MQNISYDKWLGIHNRAARDYINSEWSREVVFGVGKKRKALFAHATGNVLDVGCGYGINFPYLVNATQVTGIDFSPVMLARARETARRSRVPVDLRQEDAEALDFPDHSFDTVISSLSTCSFFNPITALQEMSRVCKPEGQILLIEHGRSSWNWLGNYQDRHVHQQIEQGGCRWNQEPQELVQEAGLNILSANRTFFGVFHTMTVSPAK
ncbi:MAG TPA: class I SAM-dependent methyltransferase [Anaerolineales bacterium]|nr:class I SAM-dependent methyltransferase [Anaerolineales bacterium]